MANEKENLEIKKKPQEVSGEELNKVAGGDGCTSNYSMCSPNNYSCKCDQYHQ